MPDLNALYYFAEVVKHGGFAPAGRALGAPKSKLSRHITQLEVRLGIRLIERSSRRFRVTEVGQAFYERCRSMMTEAEAAEAIVAAVRSEPHGLVRFSCPLAMMEPLAPVLNTYLERHPRVRLQIVAATTSVDLIDGQVDVALRVRAGLDHDASLIMRSLWVSRRILVASPAIATTMEPGAPVSLLCSLPTLSTANAAGDETWTLLGPDDKEHVVRHQARLISGDLSVLRGASIAGLGVALLPDHLCRRPLSDGSLLHVFPEWRAQDGIVHLAFTTRRGLPPAVRALIDHLAVHLREDAVLAPAFRGTPTPSPR